MRPQSIPLKRYLIVALIIFWFPLLSGAQEITQLTLEQAFHVAESNYPLLLQKGILRQTEKLNIENLNTNYLPQPGVNGQATYQSDITKVDIPLPGIKIPSPSKDQYRLIGEVNQLLYDAGMTKTQKELQSLNTSVELNKVGVELYNLKQRINSLYFAVLLQNQLLAQTQLSLKDIQLGIDKVKPQVDNAIVLKSNLDILQAELLQAQEKTEEIKATRKGFIDALSILIHQEISDAAEFLLPVVNTPLDTTISRPELNVFENQKLLFAGQQKLIDVRNRPKASAFLQTGYGKPGLNLLSNEFKGYYITGLRFTWSLNGFYTRNRDEKLLQLNEQSVDLQKQTFLLNTNSQLKQLEAEVTKFEKLISIDKQIIELRRKVTEASKAQLENAVITANDYMLQVNAENKAGENLVLHQLQLLQAKVNYAITIGKL
ncbi:MAG: TolC family protein [Candidatus Dadabacteria bacterium]